MSFKNRLTVWILFFLIGTILPASGSFARTPSNAPAPEIIRITPKGEDVPAGNQIIIEFNQPMVPLGRMDRSADQIPVDIQPACDCQWRWINTATLACQLPEKKGLKPATHYRITVKPGIKNETGQTISKTVHHEFITRRPKVRYAWFKGWNDPGIPVIRVTFNMPVLIDSVENHLFMVQNRQRISLDVQPDPADRENAVLQDKQPARRIWMISPRAQIPLDTHVTLEIEPGIESVYGPQKGVTRRTITSFDTFPAFKFLGVSGWTNDNKKVQPFLQDDPDDPEIRLNPLNRVALVFSSPVLPDQIKTHLQFMPDLAGGRSDFDPWVNSSQYSRLRNSHRKGKVYKVYLPVNLKAWESYRISSGQIRIKDEFGRQLSDNINTFFHTDHRKPDLQLDHPHAVLEKNIQSKVPLTITNIDRFHLDYTQMTTSGVETGLSTTFVPPQVKDIAFKVPLGVRKVLGKKSGVVFGQVSGEPETKKNRRPIKFFAQVTPFHVHVKAGHFNTLVWVTDMTSGKPVPKALVSIYKAQEDNPAENNPVRMLTDKNGLALLPGTSKLDPDLSCFRWSSRKNIQRLFVKVMLDDDMALVPLEYRFSVEAFRVSQNMMFESMEAQFGHIRAWGTTAQGIYRAGDTIHFKLYVRDQDNRQFTQAPREGYQLDIIDPLGKTVHEIKNLTLSEFGSFHSDVALPKTAASGWYQFRLKADFTKRAWHPMRVLVTDFTPSSFRVEQELTQYVFHTNDQVQLVSRARLHAGGPYTQAATRITARLNSRQFRPDHPDTRGFSFDTIVPEARRNLTIFQDQTHLDDQGNASHTFTLPEKGILYGTLAVETAVQDDRGKSVAGTIARPFIGRDRFVGLKHTQWVYSENSPARIQSMVVDENGVPAAGTMVTFTVEKRETRASRVKSAGNAFITQYSHEWVPLQKQITDGKTPDQSCEFTPKMPGSYRVTAAIRDTKGRAQQTRLWMWVAGKGQVVWQTPEDNRLEIIPEQKALTVGQTARYLIKNPFPGAHALITLERFGVIKKWTQTLDTSTPIIEFPVTSELVPGFYLSVVVTAPRAAKPAKDFTIDLGKPVFRMGYVAVPVKDSQKEIHLNVATGKPVYKPGETVALSITQSSENPNQVSEPLELAVAVLDEAVFQLLKNGKDNFDPFQNFYHLDGLDLKNYNLLTRLMGLQALEAKGATQGGGGGPDIRMRSVFKFVSYWNPSVRTTPGKTTKLTFQTPDNLTGWRILVMAVNTSDRMGLSQAQFRVNQPTEIRPVMPNQIMEGDQFDAGFNILNRTDKDRDLNVSIRVEGDYDPAGYPSTNSQLIKLGPYQRTTVWLPVKALKKGNISFEIKAYDRMDQDGIVHTIPVKSGQIPVTVATHAAMDSPHAELNVKIPDNIHTREDSGQISVVISPSLISNLEGAFQYLKAYPHSCWEQKLSKAVGAALYLKLKPYLPKDFSWDEAPELVRSVTEKAFEHQAPNGAMCYYIPSDTYQSPYLSAFTLLAFSWLEESGHPVPENVEEKLTHYLEQLLKKNTLPPYYSDRMIATIRATALCALAQKGRLNVEDLSRFERHLTDMTLFGKALYLTAALKTPDADTISSNVIDHILSFSEQTPGKIQFFETLDNDFNRILSSPARANAALLIAFTAADRSGRKKTSGLPLKMIRPLLDERKSNPSWHSTQTNVFCLKAIADYARMYESRHDGNQIQDSTGPAWSVTSWIGDVEKRTTFKKVTDPAQTSVRPIREDDPGKQILVRLERKGDNRIYYTTKLEYSPLALPKKRALSGMDIRREISVERDGNWQLLKTPAHISKGDIIKVDLFLSIATERYYAMVEDPVPGGLEPVNRDLATTSFIDAEKAETLFAPGSYAHSQSSWKSYRFSRWSFYHREFHHDRVVFYSEYLPAGHYHLSYTAQAIAPGTFTQMPVHAFEMYHPEVFGKGKPAKLNISR